MAISQTQSFLTEIIEGKPIPEGKLEYFRERLRRRLYEIVLSEFLHRESLTQAELARRIGKRSDQVNRLLGASGNWTLNTVSDLLLGMESELDFKVTYVADKLKGDDSQTESAKTLSDMTSPLPANTSSQVYHPRPVSGIGGAALKI